jgi:phosphate transport system ATP-binding protein
MRFEVRELGVEIGGRRLFEGLSFALEAGEVLALRGRSGSGKTTVLRSLAGLIPTASGTIELDGQGAGQPSWPRWRRRVSLLPQRPALRPGASIFDELRRPFEFEAVEASFDGDAARALLDELGVGGLSQAVDELSEGQRQRVALVRVLLLAPTILLLDEPTSALDPISTAYIEELIFELRADYTIVIVTHNLQQAARIADYTGLLYLGEIVELNDTKTLFTTPREKRTEDYVTGRFG